MGGMREGGRFYKAASDRGEPVRQRSSLRTSAEANVPLSPKLIAIPENAVVYGRRPLECEGRAPLHHFLKTVPSPYQQIHSRWSKSLLLVCPWLMSLSSRLWRGRCRYFSTLFTVTTSFPPTRPRPITSRDQPLRSRLGLGFSVGWKTGFY